MGLGGLEIWPSKFLEQRRSGVVLPALAGRLPSGCTKAHPPILYGETKSKFWVRLRRFVDEPYTETFAENRESLLDAGQLGGMTRIEEPADLLFITTQPVREIGLGDSCLPESEIEGRLGRGLSRDRNQRTISCHGGLRDRIAPVTVFDIVR